VGRKLLFATQQKFRTQVGSVGEWRPGSQGIKSLAFWIGCSKCMDTSLG